MSLLPFLVYFNRRGTHIAPQKLKVSGLRCYTLLVEELPFFVSQDSSSAHPLFSSWGTAETLCCVPSHAGRFTSLLTPTTNWQSKGSGQARDVLAGAGLLQLTTIIPRCNPPSRARDRGHEFAKSGFRMGKRQHSSVGKSS